MNRFQHAIPAGLIALVGLWVCFVSYTQTPAAAFAFPRLISTVFVAFALWTFFNALRGGAAQEGVSAGKRLSVSRPVSPWP